MWDIFSSELKLRFGMPEFPLMYTANLFAITKAGYSFKEASALNQVKNCKKPMLFIHGTADDFIPYEMMDILYQAKPGNNKEKITPQVQVTEKQCIYWARNTGMMSLLS